MPSPGRAAALGWGRHSPPPEKPLAPLPAPGRGPGPCTRLPARRRPGPGPRSALGPSARFFVARPRRSIAPSPSPAAGKGHPRTGGGGAARRPSHPGRPPALRGRFWPGRAHSCRPCLSVPCFPPFYLCLSGQTGFYLFFAGSCFSSRFLPTLSPSLRRALFLSLSLTRTLSPRPPWGPRSLLPPS